MLLGLAHVPRPLQCLSTLLFSHLPSLTLVVHTLISLSRAWALYKGRAFLTDFIADVLSFLCGVVFLPEMSVSFYIARDIQTT